jgi:predicted enzyme related to lactoylglutathione lyase
MTDPLDVLREPDGPVAPDRSFALRLRARLERALELPRGVGVSTATIGAADRTAVTAAEPPPAAAGGAIPYLAVRDGRAAIDWYVEVFGAAVDGDPIVMPDGRIGHAELSLAGGKLYLADEFPDIGVVAPSPDAAAVSLVLAVSDVDARVAAATAHGGRLTREVAEAYGSRNATLVDPFGHRWMLQQPIGTVPIQGATSGEAPPAPWHQGDVGYVSIWTPDVNRAADFYASVLGWTYHVHEEQGRQVSGQSMHIGMWGGQQRPSLFVGYAVGDVDAAVARVRAAGGTSEGPKQAPYGRAADCVDDQGRPFSVFTPPAGDPGQRPPVNGSLGGDLSYLTYEVVDSERTRDFYGAALGWEFTPGRVDDGWQVRDIAPMSGIGGGAAEQRAVPMWRVDDITSAVERVRAGGGIATDPAQQPYGLTSECVDDQGMRFYLGQH